MNYIKTIYALILLLTVQVGYSQEHHKPDAISYSIAYSSKASGDGEIYLTNAIGTSTTKITNRQGNDGYAAWSPDGKRIACYAYHDGRKTWSIHTMNIDGTNRKRLTHVKNKWDSAPAWSPDGKKIAFGRAYNNTAGIWQEEIWIMNADGSNQKQIQSINGGAPHFTPDGRIVFHSKTKTSEICIVNIDGSNLIKLTNNDAEDWHPEVSADGKQIVFMSNRDGNHEIYRMNINGSDQKRLTFNEDFRDSTPTWSPDGSKILYTSHDKDWNSDIYIMNSDGSDAKKLIENAGGQAWLKTTNLNQNLPTLVAVEGGTFIMGDEWGISNKDQRPTHEVTLKSFAISKTEVTVAQYRAYCEATGAKMPKEPDWGWKDKHPIVNVSWQEAMNYTRWLSEQLGKKIRLPYEAEWEYAARGGNDSKGYKYSGGNNIDELGWYGNNAEKKVHPVASKKANELGLYDMSGNAWEWCMDRYSTDYYENSPKNNPKGETTGDRRVIRGGGWLLGSKFCTVAYRYGSAFNGEVYDYFGFRVASEDIK